MPFTRAALLGGTPSFTRRGTRDARSSREAELLEHDRLVPLFPTFLHLSTDQPIDDETIERYALPRRRRRTQGPCMRSSGVPAKRCSIPLDELVLYRKVKVGECQQHPGNELLPGTHPVKWHEHTGYVDDAVRSERAVRRGYISAIETIDPDALVLQERFH